MFFHPDNPANYLGASKSSSNWSLAIFFENFSSPDNPANYPVAPESCILFPFCEINKC
jgi:hypothetical protein